MINLKDIKIIKSKRKTISIEITSSLDIIVRAPYKISYNDILDFVSRKSCWIEKHLKIMEQRNSEAQSIPRLTYEDIKRLSDDAIKIIPERVSHFANHMGVTYNKITIRNQKTRWGSCSSLGNLNFNCLLMLTPPDVIDYVIVHELCHIKEMNHSSKFWNEVKKILPDYEFSKKWLKENGGKIIRHMTG